MSDELFLMPNIFKATRYRTFISEFKINTFVIPFSVTSKR